MYSPLLTGKEVLFRKGLILENLTGVAACEMGDALGDGLADIAGILFFLVPF